jgi:hypothetical protein
MPVAFKIEAAHGARLRARSSEPSHSEPCTVRHEPFIADWIIYAAPFSVAVLWAVATGASLLLWSVTGLQGPLDWCRSGGVLAATGVLALLAALAASLLKGVLVGPDRFADPLPRRRPMVELPAEWLREESGLCR